MSDKKIRVLALCDSPTSATGFAQVSRNILRGLAATGKYEIDVIGINYHGDYYDRTSHPYNIYPAQPQGYPDMYGRGRVLNALTGNESQAGLQAGWDILFTIQDPFIIEGLGLGTPMGDQLRIYVELWKRTLGPNFWFKWIGYFPVDADLKENWVTRSIALPNVPVAYCDWGKDKMLKWDKENFELKFKLGESDKEHTRWAKIMLTSLKDRVQVIPHGVDTGVFKPLSDSDKKKFRKDYFKDLYKAGTFDDETFLVVNVSRNQPRKDIPRTMAAFAEFKKKVKNSHLYLHMRGEDLGGSVEEIGRNFNLAHGRDFSIPMDFNAGIGYPVEVVNKIYNVANLCMTTTMGEGWGFITTEAMAAKTPIIAPNITSMLDIFNSKEYDGTIEGLSSEDLRGIPVNAGTTSSEWVCLGLDDNERIRPLTNVSDMVEKMVWAYEHRDTDVLKSMTERAYTWVQSLAWENVVKQWDSLFMETYKALQEERVMGDKIDKTGRNDVCPCGSGLKFKKCHGSGEKIDRVKEWFIEEETTENVPKAA